MYLLNKNKKTLSNRLKSPLLSVAEGGGGVTLNFLNK